MKCHLTEPNVCTFGPTNNRLELAPFEALGRHCTFLVHDLFARLFHSMPSIASTDSNTIISTFPTTSSTITTTTTIKSQAPSFKTPYSSKPRPQNTTKPPD